MKPTVKRTALWVSRIALGLMAMGVLGLFMLDQWRESNGLWKALAALPFIVFLVAIIFFGLGLLVEASVEEIEAGAMRPTMRHLLFWTPRISVALFAVFLGLFALDVFGAGYGFWQTLGALLIHLIPAGMVLVVLLIAWHREWIGGVMFTGLGILYIVTMMQRWQWGFAVALPLLVIGALFLLNWRYRQELHPGV